jgi:hypothetical protein
MALQASAEALHNVRGHCNAQPRFKIAYLKIARKQALLGKLALKLHHGKAGYQYKSGKLVRG